VVDRLQLMGNLRYDRIHFAVNDQFIGDDPDDTGTRTMDALSPAFGLLWRPVDDIGIYGNVASAFETPTTTELANRPDGAGGFNPELHPQQALSIEAGMRGHHLSFISWQLAMYTIAVTDELIPYQVPNVQSRDYFRNAGSATHRGIEAMIDLVPFSGAHVAISYTLTDAHFDSYTVDGKIHDRNRVPGVAPGEVQVIMSYLFSPGWFIAADVRSVSSIHVDDGNSAFSPAYTVVNLRAGQVGLQFTSGDGSWQYTVHAFAGISNLFNASYISAVTVNAFGGRYYEPAPERRLYFGVELGFGKIDK
jgi:iron complex outermembrane recepter protein